jgi:signal transduction histidine kinase
MTERKDRGGRPFRPSRRSLVSEIVDSLPLPAAIITDFEEPLRTVRSNAVPFSAIGHLPTIDGSFELGEILNRRDELPARFDAAMDEVWTSGRPYHNRVDARRAHITLWACRIDLPEPLGVLLIATPPAKPSDAEFMNGVAHELRTPLSVINGYVSMLDNGDFGPVPKAWRGPMTLLNLKTRELAGMVDGLLEASRLQQDVVTLGAVPLDVAEILHLALERSGARVALLHGHVEVVLSDVPTWCRGDARVVGIIIDNLINNALSYSAKRPWVRLSVAGDDVVSVRVEDRGVGIRAELREAVFEQFARLENAAIGYPVGTGLGLYIARSAAERMGGALVLEASELGVGSTFRLDLARVEPPQRSAGLSQDSGGGRSGSGA